MRFRRSLTATALALSAALVWSGPAQAAGPFPDPGYQFTTVQSYDGHTPVALTCRAHPVKVNLNNGDPNLLDQAQRAITKVRQASGLNIYYDGQTTDKWATASPSPTGMLTAPIRLSFESQAAISQITNWGGSVPIGVAGVPVQGDYYFQQIPWFKVVVNADAYESAKATSQEEADREVYTTLIHEIGHGLGLDHTTWSSEVMYWSDLPELVDFGTGDLTGLQMLGQASCATSQVSAQQTAKKIKKTVVKKKKKAKKNKKAAKKKNKKKNKKAAKKAQLKKAKKKAKKKVQNRLAAPTAPTTTDTITWRIYQ
jgi:hypothetical protein